MLLVKKQSAWVLLSSEHQTYISFSGASLQPGSLWPVCGVECSLALKELCCHQYSGTPRLWWARICISLHFRLLPCLLWTLGNLITFFLGTGVWILYLLLARQALYSLSHVPSPFWFSCFSNSHIGPCCSNRVSLGYFSLSWPELLIFLFLSPA
jgi:hypothetical protein